MSNPTQPQAAPNTLVPVRIQLISGIGVLMAMLGATGLFAPPEYAKVMAYLPAEVRIPELPWILIVVGMVFSLGVTLSWVMKNMIPKTRRG